MARTGGCDGDVAGMPCFDRCKSRMNFRPPQPENGQDKKLQLELYSAGDSNGRAPPESETRSHPDNGTEVE